MEVIGSFLCVEIHKNMIALKENVGPLWPLCI